MSDLMNYVYVPTWLLILLAGLGFVGLEFMVSRIVRQIDRWTRPRPEKKEPKAEIVVLGDHARKDREAK